MASDLSKYPRPIEYGPPPFLDALMLITIAAVIASGLLMAIVFIPSDSEPTGTFLCHSAESTLTCSPYVAPVD